MHQRFEFHRFQKDDDCISVIIRCPNGSPGEIEQIGPGVPIFDLAHRILDGRLTEEGWIDATGQAIDCDLDIRTMLGTKEEDEKTVFYFLLGAIRLPKGTLQGGSKYDVMKEGTEMEGDAEFTDVPPEAESEDKVGRHSIEDLLGGLG